MMRAARGARATTLPVVVAALFLLLSTGVSAQEAGADGGASGAAGTGPTADTEGDAFSGGFGVGQDDSGEFSGGFGVAGDGDDSAGEGATEDGFGGGFGAAGAAAPFGIDPGTLAWGARLRFDARGYADYDRPEESLTDATAEARLSLDYAAADTEAAIRLDAREGFDPEPLALDEAYLRFYRDRFDLEAGFLKTVWGQGDEVHVVDFLNSNDYSDFINPDYIDRRRAAGMIKLNVPWSRDRAAGQVELAYLPVLRPDAIPEDGPWAPEEARILTALVGGYAEALTERRIGELEAAALTAGYPASPTGAATPREAALWAALTAGEAVIFEDTDRLEFGQAGVRATARLGGVDLGAIYYWGFLKTPTPRIRLADADAFAAFAAGTPGEAPAPDPEGSIRLVHDRLQGIGLEAATVLGPFNFRGEGAYYLTEDITGDDPEVPNNSLEYLLGFDVDLGISRLNLNVQGTGSVILESGKIDDAGPIAGVSAATRAAAASDADFAARLAASPYAVLYLDPAARLNFQWDPDGIYTSHIVSAALTDSWRNDRVRPEVVVAVGVERQDWRVAPGVEFVLRDDTRVEVTGVVHGGDREGLFGQYDANDYMQLRFAWEF
jgi:hypothetical protein